MTFLYRMVLICERLIIVSLKTRSKMKNLELKKSNDVLMSNKNRLSFDEMFKIKGGDDAGGTIKSNE